MKKKSLDLSFKSFIEEKNLFTLKGKNLLAISGGVDSVVLFHLLKDSEVPFAAAHCNFKLRGKDSDKDERFVRDLCKAHHVEFFTKSFDTEVFAKQNGISIQMAARELRYSWFAQLVSEHRFNSVCTAHHADDNIETVLLNLSRGTGIAGLTGISLQKGKLVRPLLFATKKEIKSYAKQNDIDFRKDKSNSYEYYKRNFIRKKIVPLFEKLNPSFISTLNNSVRNFQEAEMLIENSVAEAIPVIVTEKSDESKLNIAELKKFVSPRLFLFYLLRQKGIHADVESVYDLLSSQSGKEISSGPFRILRDRNDLIITSEENRVKEKEIIIKKSDSEIESPVRLKFELSERQENLRTGKNKIIADLSKLTFPLKVRKWKEGDVFHPFGMKGKKKVSDLMVDLKIPKHKKEFVYILEDNKQNIIWVIGVRADNRFKVDESTRETLIVNLTDQDYL